jgi:hypothetical protein
MDSKHLVESKVKLIDNALDRYAIKSIIDLGGCWRVNGGYMYHAIKSGKINRAFIVDGNITAPTKEAAKEYPQLTLIQGALGDPDIVKTVGKIGAVIMYDILLHQVNPNWDAFIRLWSSIADYLIIYNQNWTQDEKVIRFIDRDVDWYVKNVPHSNENRVREWYNKHNEQNVEMDRKWRDVHNFWQFGITRQALRAEVESQGFRIGVPI